MTDRDAIGGMAAFSICESLLLALRDRNLLSRSEVRGLLADAATAHDEAAALGVDAARNRAAAALIQAIVVP